MNCLGIRIQNVTKSALFNHDLALRQGMTLIQNNDFEGDPEVLRQTVERGLRQTFPHISLRFYDLETGLELDKPEWPYALLICQEAPMYSRSVH